MTVREKAASFTSACALLLLAFPAKWEVEPTGSARGAVPEATRYRYTVERDSTLSEALEALGVPAIDVFGLVTGAKPVVDLSRIRPGVRFDLSWVPGPVAALERVTFEWSATQTVVLTRASGSGHWIAQQETLPTQFRLATFQGRVESSLWGSAKDAGMDGRLIAELAEIFAWQVDFAREIRSGDRWRLVVEEQTTRPEPQGALGAEPRVLGYGRILAAEVWNRDEHYSAIWFPPSSGYFAEDGSSLRRMFLKSPIEFGRISSRFTRARFHPVLRIARPHLGVDYAAPTGTPIRAVGDGVATFVGPSGAGGNVIKIRHNSTYSTAYKHLSRFGSAMRAGRRVSQGEIIGYVGSTGLASGPHLHFEFYQSGVFVDPMGKRFPHADPVPAAWAPAFLALAQQSRALLPAWAEKSPGI